MTAGTIASAEALTKALTVQAAFDPAKAGPGLRGWKGQAREERFDWLLAASGIVLYVISTGKSHRDFPEPPADLASRPEIYELIAECVVAMAFRASSEDIARICHAHPSLSEAMKEAALAVDKRTLNF